MTATRDRSFALVLLCFFLSGLAALIYQTAWTREFAFVFGTSELAIVTVLASYMGGLAAGAAVAGRYAGRVARPVLAYGLLELGIAVAALLVPYAIQASQRLYVWLFGSSHLHGDAGGLATAIFYLTSSFVILLIPTGMMGATLPLLARHAVRDDRELGRRVGTLYAVNTAGAIAGTVCTAFFLLPTIGLRSTIAVAAAANALVFVAAWALARQSRAPVPESAAAAGAATSSGRAAWILPLAAAAGFTSFSYEVLWARLLGHIVGVGVVAFATMLASFLAGIALGSAVAARLATTRSSAALGFAVAQLGVAALSVAAFLVADGVPDLAERLTSVPGFGRWTHVTLSMATLLPPTLMIGATFPFAVRVLAQGGADAGPASARVYAWNTVGSIAGAIGAGFFLIPALGFEGMLVVGVATNLALAAAAATLFAPRRPWIVAAAAAGGIALVLLPPEPPWRILRSSSLPGRIRAWGDVAYFGIGRSSTVLVTNQHLGFGLRNTGLPEAGIDSPAVWHNRHPLTRWLSALPVLARPEARSLVLIGLGGGAAIEIVPPTIERIDVIELEPEVVAANRAIAGQRWRDPLSDPRVHIHVNDARNALLLSKDRFDVIVSQPSHPWAGGAAHLYTLEFFELAASRLSDGGVFVQWIGLPFVDEQLFRSLLATLSAAFPHVQAYNPPPSGSSVLFLASNAPLDMEASVARALGAARESFELLGITRPEDVFARLLLDEAGVAKLAAGAPINRDRHNQLERRSMNLGMNALLISEKLFGPVDPLLHGPYRALDLFYLLRRLEPERALHVARSLDDPTARAVGEAIAGITEGKRVVPRQQLAEALGRDPRHIEARAALLRLSSGELSDGADPERIVPPPLFAEERVLAQAWNARASDPGGAALRALDPQLAAIPLSHPLGHDAARLRILARITSADPKEVREAMQIADATLGDRPDPRSLLLRAEAYAAAGEHGAVLEMLSEIVPQLEPGDRAASAIVRRARELFAATPADDPQLRWLRRSAQRALGLG